MRGVLLPLLLLAAVFSVAVAFLAQRDPRLAASGSVEVARLEDLAPRRPLAIAVKLRDGYDRVLQRARTGHPCEAILYMGCPASTPLRHVTVYVVRDDGSVRAFIGEDPRNGCRLEPIVWGSAILHDVCHGSLYDASGMVVGGPSPWYLNELAVSVGPHGEVSVYPALVLTGGCGPNFSCPRPAGSPPR